MSLSVGSKRIACGIKHTALDNHGFAVTRNPQRENFVLVSGNSRNRHSANGKTNENAPLIKKMSNINYLKPTLSSSQKLNCNSSKSKMKDVGNENQIKKMNSVDNDTLNETSASSKTRLNRSLGCEAPPVTPRKTACENCMVLTKMLEKERKLKTDSTTQTQIIYQNQLPRAVQPYTTIYGSQNFPRISSSVDKDLLESNYQQSYCYVEPGRKQFKTAPGYHRLHTDDFRMFYPIYSYSPSLPVHKDWERRQPSRMPLGHDFSRAIDLSRKLYGLMNMRG